MTFNFNFHSHYVHLFAYYLSKETDSLGEYEADWLWKRCDDIVAKTLMLKTKEEGRRLELQWGCKGGGSSDRINFAPTRRPNAILTPYDGWELNPYLEVKPEFKFNIKNHLNLENEPEEPWANLNKSFPKTDDYHPIYVQSNQFFIDEKKANLDSDSKTCIIYPVELYDSYGIGLKLINSENKNDKALSSADIALVNPKNCLILDENKEKEYFLDQTLLITIKLQHTYKLKHQENQQKLQSIADKYLESLFPKNFRKPPFNRSGNLFGSPIFEYGLIRAPKSYSHVIVWFVLDDRSEDQFAKSYPQLLDLFFFRSKIIHAYRQIRKIEKEAKNKSKYIQSKIGKTQKPGEKQETNELDLDSLQKLLIELPKFSVKYAEKLRYIKKYQNIIVESTRDYTDKIHEIKSNFSDEDLSFLENFIDRTCHPFQDRVSAAVNFFQLDINLIDNAIDSIRGQLAIEQTHRERQLQTTITSLGIGIAAAGNFASSYEAGSITEKNDSYPHFHFPHFTISFITSMLVGFIVWKGFLEYFRRRFRKKQLIKEDSLIKE